MLHLVDPCSEICNRLTNKRTKPTIVKKCLELGLIQDKRELHVKRGAGGAARKKKGGQNRGDDFIVNSDGGSNIEYSVYSH